MTTITDVHAREVLDSRGQPTVEVELRGGDFVGSAIVPSGASTGGAEACELRDGEPGRYDGRGVQRAVDNVMTTIGPALLGLDPADQFAVDGRLLELDPTPQKTKLGANALLGASLAAAHLASAIIRAPLYRHLGELFARLGESQAGNVAAAESSAPRLPVPMTNMISGGLHAGGNLDFQDVLVIPNGAPDYATALEWIVRTYHCLGRVLEKAGYEGRLVGDEGGYGPRLASNREALALVVRAIEAAGLVPGDQIALALDVAASQFFDGTHYRLAIEGGRALTADQMIESLEALVDEFPLVSIEDPLAEEDWPAWQELTARLGDRIQLVGDDLFATKRRRVERGIKLGVANAVLIKPNQVGTLTETLETMLTARRAGYRLIVSARSGETEDTTIADLAVGTAAEGIKIGSVARSERLAKYNRLLRIAEELEEGHWEPATGAS